MFFLRRREKNKIFNLIANNKKFDEYHIRLWQDKDCNNLLHQAVIEDRYEIVKNLLSFNFLKEETNKLGLTPYRLSKLLNQNCSDLFGEKGDCQKSYFLEKNNKIVRLDKIAFEKYMGIDVTYSVYYHNYSLLRKMIRKCQKAKLKQLIDKKQIWMGIYYESDILAAQNDKVVVKWIDGVKEYGLFARRDILEKSFIGEYAGIVRKRRSSQDKKNSYCFEYPINRSITSSLLVDAKEKGNLSRFINHSSLPNLVPYPIYLWNIPHIIFLTNREIKEGEELTYDYGPNYWKKREKPLLN